MIAGDLWRIAMVGDALDHGYCDRMGRAEIAHKHVVHLHEIQDSRHGSRTNLPCTLHLRSVEFRVLNSRRFSAGMEERLCRE
jgi:hypothetical protein